MPLHVYDLIVTTDASGDGTKQTVNPIKGLWYGYKWMDGDLADGVDAVLSVPAQGFSPARTLLTLTNANDDINPTLLRQATVTAPGTPSTADYDYPIIDGDLLLTVSQGGDTKTGGLSVYVLEDS